MGSAGNSSPRNRRRRVDVDGGEIPMLNQYPPEEIVPALTHHNGRVRRYAAMMLDIDGDDQLVNFLVGLLQSDSPSTRGAAARALGISIRPFSDPGRAVGLGLAAVDCLAVESLTAALRDPDSLVRAHAADALRTLSVPEALPALLPMFQDPEEEVWVAAALAAGELGAPQSLPLLLEALRRGPPHRRRQAAASLRVLGDAAAVPSLMDALADPSRAVQEQAAVALGSLGDSRSVPALIDALGAPNIMVEERKGLREYLVNALGRLGDRRAVPALIRALKDYDKHVRDAALSSLVKLGGPQAEGALIDLVDKNIFHAHPDISVRVAIRNLGSMGVVRAMPMLRLVLEDGQLDWAPVAAGALRELGDTITGGDMLAWLSSPNSDRRLRAVLALPALVDRDALPHLLSALGDGARGCEPGPPGSWDAWTTGAPSPSSPTPSRAKLRKCVKRSAMRWHPWTNVASVVLRHPNHTELRQGLGGLVFSSARLPPGVAWPPCLRKRAAPYFRALWRAHHGSHSDGCSRRPPGHRA